jgi:hypothetical protein
MRLRRGVTALAAAGLLAATLSGAAAEAATSTAAGSKPGACTPSWKLVSAPAGPFVYPQMMITGLAVDRAGQAWFPATGPGGEEATQAWAYHWTGHSFGATTTLPEGSYTDRASDSGEPFDGPWAGPVSFDSNSDGWMIGDEYLPDQSLPEYAAHWSGGRWTIVPLPVSPKPESVTLYTGGVAAVSPSDAWAVGTYSAGSGLAGALIEHWNGTQWSIFPNPASGQAGAWLTAITALSRTDIWAVGEQSAADGTIKTFTEHWNGQSWTVVPAPAAAAPSRFIAVSADSPTDAWAVGSQLQAGTGNSATALVEHWNGKAWSVVKGLPALGNGELLRVYAASSSDVWATVYAPRADTDLGTDEFLHWNGKSWSTVPVPGPHEYGLDYEYTGIAGTGPGNIWAAGWAIHPQVTISGNPTTPLIAHLTCG